MLENSKSLENSSAWSTSIKEETRKMREPRKEFREKLQQFNKREELQKSEQEDIVMIGPLRLQEQWFKISTEMENRLSRAISSKDKTPSRHFMVNSKTGYAFEINSQLKQMDHLSEKSKFNYILELVKGKLR